MTELLSPAGNLEKLRAALYFGADAVYVAGERYRLRAFADNFTADELREAIAYAHRLGRKVYVACNIYAHNRDFAELDDYLACVQAACADAVIVSDLGVLSRLKRTAPSLPVHVSTQANTTNKYAAAAWRDLGADRIVLARELTLAEIGEIRDFLPDSVTLEAFVHGAMCISYSGRCLLSDYMTGRHSNAGACAQSCRWEYALYEKSRGEWFELAEDDRGSYILNSRDMNMLAHLDALMDAGVQSFKIEGRVKTTYYVACVTNAYRRALDDALSGRPVCQTLLSEPYKTGHRDFTTGFYLGDRGGQRYETSKPSRSYDFVAVVVNTFAGGAIVEMRNRFAAGDVLEVLAPGDEFNRTIEVGRIETEDGLPLGEVTAVQQRVRLYTDVLLKPMDILRRPV